jgi:molybdopterin synthase catalytic subunit
MEHQHIDDRVSILITSESLSLSNQYLSMIIWCNTSPPSVLSSSSPHDGVVGSYGSISTFIGITRKDTKPLPPATTDDSTASSNRTKSTSYLTYETYPAMALQQLADICAEIFDGRSNADASQQAPSSSAKPFHSGVGRIAITHTLTKVPLGDPSCYIIVSSEHRDDGLNATRYVIEELKKRVAIWKKEVYLEDGVEKEEEEVVGNEDGVWKKNKEWIVGGGPKPHPPRSACVEPP